MALLTCRHHISGSRSYCRVRQWIAWLAAVIIISSCLKSEDFSDLELQQLEPTLAFALLSTELTSDELVNLLDSMAMVEENGVFTLNFAAERFVQTTEDLLPALDFSLPVPIVDTLTTIPLPPLLGFQVRTAELLGESVVFTFNSDVPDTVHLTVEIPVLNRDGENFKQTFTLDPAQGLFSTFTSDPISISGYTLDLSSGILQMRYSAITTSGSRIRLPLSFMQITGLEFGFVQGGLGRISIPSGLQTVPFELPDSLLSGDITFLRPQLKFMISNSVGVPVAIRALQLYVTEDNGSRIDIQSSLLTSPIPIDFPALSERGSTVFQEIVLDNSNSNIADVLKPSIRELAYEVEVIANPNNSGRDDFFLTDSSAASLDASLTVPLDVRVGQVNIDYTLPVEVDTIDNIAALRLKLYVENGIPLAFGPRLDFTGPDTKITMAEESGLTIAAASTDASGTTLSPTVSELFFTLPSNQIDQLPAIDSVRLQLSLSSNSQADARVQIGSSQRMKIGLGVEITLQP